MKICTVIAVVGAAALTTTSANAGVVLANVDPAIIASSASVNADTMASIEFVNHLSYDVDVYWMNYSGQPVFYYDLAADSSYIQNTYLTHPWLITQASSGDLITGFASAVTPDPGWTDLSPDIANIGSVPEPATWAMLILGMGAIGFVVRSRRGAFVAV
jgi:PEP-CTERM motif/VHL beta domain